MATRIESILTRARDSLADAAKERWSDEHLLRILDEGQKDIARHTRLLKDETDIPLVEGQAVYKLPSDLWLITRAAFDGCLIPLRTHNELDELVRTRALSNEHDYHERRGYTSYDRVTGSFCWELDTGSEVTALVFDKRNLDEIRVYPIPDEGIASNSYTFTTDNPEFAGAELLGVATDITDYSFDSVFGVVTDMYDPLVEVENFPSDFGVLTGVNEAEGVVHIWYIKNPTDITSVDDILEIPSMFDTALKHYVVAHAYDDDIDTGSQQKSIKALQYYERELDVGRRTDATDGVRYSKRRTDYRGAFE
jgi:hypothetical protein